MVQRHTSPEVAGHVSASRSRWPLAAAAAGLLGLAGAVSHGREGEVAVRVAEGLGMVTALLLLLSAATWRRLVEPRTRSSTAAHVVSLAMTVSAAGLAMGHASLAGWLGVWGAAGAMTWMGMRERTVTRSVGGMSLLAVLAVPVVPDVAAPLWLLVSGVMLAGGRSTITR